MTLAKDEKSWPSGQGRGLTTKRSIVQSLPDVYTGWNASKYYSKKQSQKGIQKS